VRLLAEIRAITKHRKTITIQLAIALEPKPRVSSKRSQGISFFVEMSRGEFKEGRSHSASAFNLRLNSPSCVGPTSLTLIIES